MGSNLMMRRAAACAILAAGLAAATPAMAGRCGHSYAVDTPTTLSKVARACNVSYGALVEANRGVDPSYVRPGEHLAVPDEIEYAGDIGAPGPEDPVIDDEPVVSHPYVASRPVNSYRSYYDDSSDVRRVNVSASATYFDTYNTAPIHAQRDERLSYQKLSAARIRNAGYAPAPATSSPVFIRPAPLAGELKTISAYPTPLMECSVLRRQPDGKIRQVREVKPVPADEEKPLHCTSLTANDGPRRAIMTRGAGLTPTPAEDLTVLRGYVSHVGADCMTLESDDGMVWRMSAPVAAGDMLGKEATIWAEFTRAPACGGLVMDHAVYAERL
jgi:LysM repeat protein